MDGVSISVELRGFEAAELKLQRLEQIVLGAELMDALGRLGQQQTKRRIEVEKTTPDGAAWPRTRDGRGALFVTGAHLDRSIDYEASATEARWGSGFIGARVHQYGAVITPKNAKVLAFVQGGQHFFAKKVTIPSRAYVGMSEANKTEMVDVAARFVAGAAA